MGEILAFLESSALLIIRDSLISFKEFVFIFLRLSGLYRGNSQYRQNVQHTTQTATLSIHTAQK